MGEGVSEAMYDSYPAGALYGVSPQRRTPVDSCALATQNCDGIGSCYMPITSLRNVRRPKESHASIVWTIQHKTVGGL